MRKAATRASLAIVTCLVWAACAGYRGGWESFAYIGDAPPPPPPESRTRYEASVRAPLIVPGLQMHVSINNQVRTYDRQVYLYAIPAPGRSREESSQQSEPGKTRVFIRVTPAEPGFVLRPALAVLSVGGESFGGVVAHEFGQWDSEGNRVERGGAWGYRALEPEIPLAEVGREYLLRIDFETPLPSPRSRDISLDLSRALRSPDHPPIPPIRFLPIRWREGYS